jgi:transcriptional regulator with XRE-family HTH domain
MTDRSQLWNRTNGMWGSYPRAGERVGRAGVTGLRAGASPGDGVRAMTEPASVQALRRELGAALRAGRRTSGYSQAQLALQVGYARSTVSTVESGIQNVPRSFWERCDEALDTGTELADGYDRLARYRLAGVAGRAGRGMADSRELREVPPGHGRRAGDDPGALTVAAALAAYQRLGWAVREAGGRIELVCGDGLEALEVPRAAGVVAIRWWLHTGGAPDEMRGLPGMPGPQEALAAIADTGDRIFFLVQSGAFPWAGPDLAGPLPAAGPPAARRPGGDVAPVVRWHGAGSRVPAPPSRDPGGRRVAWAHPPPPRPRLADPVVLLDLLARAVALTGPCGQVLTMPGGVCVVPTGGAEER